MSPSALQLLNVSPSFQSLRCLRTFEIVLCYVINHKLILMNGQCKHFTNIPDSEIYPPAS